MSNLSVVVIDDSPDIRRLLTRALTNEGISVFTAENGEDAKAVMGQLNRPSIVLLDLMMPVLDGFEFLKWKNEQAEFREWPVIILSASTHADIPEGAKAYLKKPVELDSLFNLIGECANEAL